MIFDVEVEEILQRVVSVEANSKADALRIVADMYDESEIILDSDDLKETTYMVLDNN